MKHKNKAVEQKLRAHANFLKKYKVALHLRKLCYSLAWKQWLNQTYGPMK